MVAVAVVAAIALLAAGFVGGGLLKKDGTKTAAISGTSTSSTQSGNLCHNGHCKA